MVPLVALEREWRTLVRGELAVEYRRWARAEPVLAAFAGPERLLVFLWDEEGSPEGQDRVLAALLVLARTESLAARVLLQALLPGLKARAAKLLRRRPGGESTTPALERDELWQVLFVSLLERIQTYPLERRSHKIASNLLWDTEHVTLVELKRARSGLEELAKDEPIEPANEQRWSGADVEAPLRRAVAAGAISEADAELIAETEIEGVALEEVANRLGVTYNAVKVRRQKAERRLLTFLNDEAEIPYLQVDPDSRRKRPTSVRMQLRQTTPAKQDGRSPAAGTTRPARRLPAQPQPQIPNEEGGTALEGI